MKEDTFLLSGIPAFCWTSKDPLLATSSPFTKVGVQQRLCALGLPLLSQPGVLLEGEHIAVRVNVILQLPGEE